MKENIKAAIESMQDARSDILGALSHATPVSALLVENLLAEQMTAINNAKRLLAALESDDGF